MKIYFPNMISTLEKFEEKIIFQTDFKKIKLDEDNIKNLEEHKT